MTLCTVVYGNTRKQATCPRGSIIPHCNLVNQASPKFRALSGTEHANRTTKITIALFQRFTHACVCRLALFFIFCVFQIKMVLFPYQSVTDRKKKCIDRKMMFNLFRRKNGTYNKTFFISHFYSILCDANVSCLKLCRGRDLTKDFIVNYNNNSPFSRFIKKSFCEVDGLNEARIIKQLLLFLLS